MPPLWRQIQQENFTKIGPLLDFLDLSKENRERILLKSKFVLNLPLRLAKKIVKNDLNDPILRQFIPLIDEDISLSGFTLDPVQDCAFQKTEKLLHKYHARALILTTSACAMHCRYCFRQNFPYEKKIKNFEAETAYLKKDPTITEVILSGGDPLSLSDEQLADLLRTLDAIPSIQRIRFHTRFPIGIPERIDPSFLHLLASSSKQMFFCIHANHPRELDEEVLEALKKIQRLGISLLNQSVLLRGVNDSEEALIGLSQTLLNAGIIPYYLHTLDPVEGSSHFVVSETRSLALVRAMQTHLSGFGVPRLAKEEPGQLSKTFVMNTDA